MKTTKNVDIETAKTYIVKLAASPLQRKDLVIKCLELCVINKFLTAQDLKDTMSGQPLNVAKCRIGDAIEQLLQSGVLIQNDDKSLACKNLVNDEDNSPACKNADPTELFAFIENSIRELLSKNSYTSTELIKAVVALTPKTMGFETKFIKAATWRILMNLKKNKAVTVENKRYCIAQKPETPQERTARLFAEISDEGLVVHTVAMLQKWYEHIGYSNVEGKNTDGPQDDGIDGVITAMDMLGFSEKIILQVKNYHSANKYVPLCELREFGGVLAADPDATKGLFVTSKKFHSTSVKFVKKYKTKYFVLIDGEKWLQLAAECNYQLS